MGTPILLLADMVPGAALADMIEFRQPGREVTVLTSRAALDNVLRTATPENPNRSRLIGFFTGVIVPERYLSALSAMPVNFHPGPPAYPGKHPLAFAVHEGATEFGVTAHAMTAAVDTGPVIAVARFAVDAGASEAALQYRTFRSGFNLFRRLLPDLLRPEPLPLLPGARWGDRDCSQDAPRRLRGSG